MEVYAWLIDWFNPPSEKLPHGDDFRVGPKVIENRGTIQYQQKLD